MKRPNIEGELPGLPGDFDTISAPLLSLASPRKVDDGYLGIVTPTEGFAQTPKYNFGRYAETKAYKQANYDLIANVLGRLPQQSLTLVDVAMGHGMVPRLVISQLAGTAGTDRRVHVIGTDLDSYAVERARANIHDTNNTHVTFLQGDARHLRKLLSGYVSKGGVHLTTIHDALHEVRDDKDKLKIIGSQADILMPGGLLSLITGFTTAAAGMEYGVWLVEFMKQFGAYRYKGNDVEGMPVHPPVFYRSLPEKKGLKVIHDGLVDVPHDQEALDAISEYPPFVQGFTERVVFPRLVKMDEAVDGMKRAIPLMLKRANKIAISRKFYEVIAQKAA